MFREELAEYRSLCEVLAELCQRYEKQKANILLLLKKMTDVRQCLDRELGKTIRLSRRLSVLQRNQLGLLYAPHGSFFTRNNENVRNNEIDGIIFPLKMELEPAAVADLSETFKTLHELRAAVIRTVSMIDTVKKQLFRMELLELRLRELLFSIDKALEAYKYEWRIIRRKIYPLGVISICYKSLRELWGASHFSKRDLNELAVLGNLTGNILKMADSPAI